MDTPFNLARDCCWRMPKRLIRTRGCNGFSYRDLAEHVGVKTSSIHYYFPGKDDLLYEAVEPTARARVPYAASTPRAACPSAA